MKRRKRRAPTDLKPGLCADAPSVLLATPISLTAKKAECPLATRQTGALFSPNSKSTIKDRNENTQTHGWSGSKCVAGGGGVGGHFVCGRGRVGAGGRGGQGRGAG